MTLADEDSYASSVTWVAAGASAVNQMQTVTGAAVNHRIPHRTHLFTVNNKTEITFITTNVLHLSLSSKHRIVQHRRSQV